VLRRVAPAPAAARQLRFEGLLIDLDRHAVQRQGEAVELTGTEFELLAMLAGAPGKVFSRDDILEKLRGRSAEDIHSRAVDILVSRLRRKLEPLDCIHTLRNAGYRFAGVRA
jgi:two-component system OmpR family response regulator